MTGWLVYRKQDAERNHHYITFYREACQKRQVTLLLKLLENFSWDEEEAFSLCEAQLMEEKPDFIVMRADVPALSKRMEDLKFRVFNNSQVSFVANDKWKTLSLAAANGIPIPESLFADKKNAVESGRRLGYPLVMKPRDGHGGQDVLMLRSESALTETLEAYPHETFLMQKPVSALGKDLRIYVMGKEIVASMLRSCQTDFRSNYCLGGDASAYTLSPEERALAEQVIGLMDFDFVGIDFMFDEGQMILNEIEDVVGARMLYHLTDIDVVDRYVEYILAKVTAPI